MPQHRYCVGVRLFGVPPLFALPPLLTLHRLVNAHLQRVTHHTHPSTHPPLHAHTHTRLPPAMRRQLPHSFAALPCPLGSCQTAPHRRAAPMRSYFASTRALQRAPPQDAQGTTSPEQATAAETVAETTTAPPSSRHPMEVLSSVFHRHPPALRLHRELTIAIADGDAERAGELANVLARTVRRVMAAAEAAAGTPTDAGATARSQAAEVESGEMPRASAEDVTVALDKTREALLAREGGVAGHGGDEPGSLGAGPSPSALPPFWRDPAHLCVTVVESAFETEVPDGEVQGTLSAAGNAAAAHEAAQLRILDGYLEKEAVRWKAQKAAVAKIVLDVARSLGVTPAELQSAEGLEAQKAGADTSARLNVLRHSNLVVRGEVPSAAAVPTSPSARAESSVEAELGALIKRMAALGQTMSAEEERMARYELQMSKVTMRYLVGVHRDLRLALDTSTALQEALQRRGDADSHVTTGAELFTAAVIRALNEGAEAYSADAVAAGAPLSLESVQAREAAATPVLPFTFMLKCCLWFNSAPPPA